MRSVSNNHSTLQAPGSDPHNKDPWVGMDGNKVRHPEEQVLAIDTGQNFSVRFSVGKKNTDGGFSEVNVTS